MTYRPSDVYKYFSDTDVTQATLKATVQSGPPVVVDGTNNLGVFGLSVGDVALADITIVFPSGSYGDSISASYTANKPGLPFRFSGVDGFVAVEITGLSPGTTVTYLSGTATWLGIPVGAEITVSESFVSPIKALEARIKALETAPSSAGGGAVSYGGASCDYGSMTGAVSTAALGYTSGNGFAAVSPVAIDKILTFSKIGFEIGTVYPSAVTYTCLLYDSVDGYPGSLLTKVDVSTTTTGGKKYVSMTPIELQPGTYWIGLWVGSAEGTGTLVNNTGIGLVMSFSPSGNGNSGNQRMAAGWKSNNMAQPSIGSNWPSRTASGMATDYRVPRVTIWAG